jgi:hypothetical protein
MALGRRLLVVITLVLAAGIAGAGAAHADARAGGGGGAQGEEVAASLVGTWTGPKSGAEGGKFATRAWKVVVKRANANAFIGTKQYKQPNGRWSKPEIVNAVVDSDGHIWASDTDGVLNGSLSEDGTLELVYQEPGTEDGAAVIALLRRQS